MSSLRAPAIYQRETQVDRVIVLDGDYMFVRGSISFQHQKSHSTEFKAEVHLSTDSIHSILF